MPSMRPSTGAGIQLGQYTVSPTSFASFCQPAFQAFGQDAAGAPVALVVAESLPPQPATSTAARARRIAIRVTIQKG